MTDTPKTDIFKQAFNSVSVDIVGKILQSADNPAQCSDYIVEQLRELTGARTVFLIQCLHNIGGEGHRIVSLSPERRRPLIDSNEVQRLIDLVHEETAPVYWQAHKDNSDASHIMASLNYDSSMAIPLITSHYRIGAILALDLPPTPTNTSYVIEFMDMISNVIALIFRNSLLFEQQDSIIEERTKNLKKSEQLFRNLATMAPVGIFRADTNGNCIYVNDTWSKLAGIPEEKAYGKDWAAALHPDDRQRVINEWYSCAAENSLFSAEYRFQTPNGKTSWLLGNAMAELDKTGDIQGYIGTITDITESKELEEEQHKLEGRLHQAQKMEAVGTLAGGIAHDFNNILTAIIGFTDIAITEVSESSSLKAHLDQVLKAGNRAKELVKQILAFSRQTNTQRQPIQVHLIIKEVLKLLRATMPTTIEIRQDINPNGGLVLADPTQIHQVIMNLATNAFHAMQGKEGVLAVSLKTVAIDNDDRKVISEELIAGHYVKLEVSDTGCGMDVETLQRIFDPYFSTKDKGKGTGLGLAVVHGIVKDYGGHIRAYSEPEKGTTFTVYLPQVRSASQPVQESAEQKLPTGTEHILFVDDEDVIIQMSTIILEGLGYKVSCVTSSREAFALFKKQPDLFDLVITDMTMPHMTGAELAQKILHHRPNTPIILCTGFSELIDGEKAKHIGIKEFLMKPVIRRDLAESVRRVLDES